MIRLRSPRSFKSTGFSHTDKCMVGLKKNTLSSPVQTTHLEKREMLSCTHTHTQKHNPTAIFFVAIFTKKYQWRKTPPSRPKRPRERERILGHTWQLRMTKTRCDEFHPLIQISDVFLSLPTFFFFFHNHPLSVSQDFFYMAKNPQYVQNQVSTSLLYVLDYSHKSKSDQFFGRSALDIHTL